MQALMHACMKIIAISGYKGGVGKSCTAIHVAEYLSNCGKVLLIDSDPNRSCERWAERGDRQQGFTVCNDKQASRLIPGRNYLVLDTPARPASDELKDISESADLTILPCIPDAFALDPMLDMLPDLSPGSVYRCLLTICPPPPSKEASEMREALEANGLPIFKAQIRRSAGFSKSAFAGVPVNKLPAAQRLGWLDYQELGNEITTILEA
jgi:chromosome partitioning protein